MALNVRRVVTGHDRNGKAVVRIDDLGANLAAGRANVTRQNIWTTNDLPVAFGRRSGHELKWGRISTVALALVSAGVAQASGTLVAFLGIFGWGLFGSTIVPALAIGLNWEGATRSGAIASISTGLGITLIGETLGFFKLYALPTGVSISGLSLIISLLVFFAVSWLTRGSAGRQIDPDIKLVMEA